MKTGWAGTKLLLDLLKESSDIFPPLKCAVGGLVALIDVYEVRGPFEELRTEAHKMRCIANEIKSIRVAGYNATH